MNFKQALSLLQLREGFTEDDLKKQFRKLAAKYHPDINKEPGAEQKSKEISEAYNFLKDPKNWKFNTSNNIKNNNYKNKSNTVKVNFNNTSFKTININDILKMKTYYVPAKTVKISLKDAIVGCTIKTTVDWTEPCVTCTPNPNNCASCKGTKTLSKNGTWSLSLAAGIQHNATINLEKELNGRKYVFAFVVLVEEHPKFNRQVNDILFKQNISLLQALQGGTVEAETLTGKVTIEIKPKTKNNDLVIVNSGNLPNSGKYKAVMIVDYPEDVSNLINFLKESK